MRTAGRLRVVLGLVLLVVAGCSGPARTARTGVVLTLVADRDFGFESLLKEYMTTHPGITVQEKTTGGADGDLAVVDDYATARIAQQPAGYADLAGDGPWGNWALPVSVDGLAMCYQRNLLAAAGLPTDRRAVAALWPTWDAYLEAGQRFETAKLPARWVDSALSVYHAVLAQQSHGYYRTDGTLSVSGNAAVKNAWRVATGVTAVGESAQLKQLTPQWVAAAQSGRFATLPCPSWMLGWMKRNVSDLRGDWDIATAPGGHGSMATYHLVVPKSGRYARQAQQLAGWLAAPAQQLTGFRRNSLLPASAALRAEDAVRAWMEPYVSDAPIGEIFTASVTGRSPQPVGPDGSQVRSTIDKIVTRVDGWEISAAAGWTAVTAAYPA